MAKINKIYTTVKPCVFQEMLNCNPEDVSSTLCSRKAIEEFTNSFHTCLNPDLAPPGFLEDLDVMIQKAQYSHLIVECRNFPQICTCDVVINYVRMEADKPLTRR